MAAPSRRTPVADVRDAVAAGALSRTDIARRTGLTSATVDAALDFLERTGRLRREPLASSCSSGSCSGCSHAAPGSGDAPSCGLHGDADRGPVALVLSPTRGR